MQVGTVVRYIGKQSPSDPIGLVIDIHLVSRVHNTVLVQWNNGARQWRHASILEDVCE